MQCTACGYELPPGVQRCGNCGASALPPPPTDAQPVAFPYDGRGSRWPTVFKVLGVAAALVVIGVAVAPLVTDVNGEVRTTADGIAPSEPVTTPPTGLGTASTLSPITPETSATVATETTLPATIAPGATNVAGLSVTATCTARGSTDSQGNPIDFKPENTLDGDPLTAWRCGGDGRGVSLTYVLPAPSAIAQVGAVPGFAANDPFNDTDRFSQNRRVASAAWTCLDGSGATVASVPQTFADTRELQTVAAAGFEGCASVRLEITGATASGGRDFVAMSDVAVIGKT